MKSKDKLAHLYDAAWTATIQEKTLMVGLIAIKICNGHLYVLVSRNKECVDVEAYESALLPDEKMTFAEKICDTANYGYEISYANLKKLFPGECVLLNKAAPTLFK